MTHNSATLFPSVFEVCLINLRPTQYLTLISVRAFSVTRSKCDDIIETWHFMTKNHLICCLDNLSFDGVLYYFVASPTPFLPWDYEKGHGNNLKVCTIFSKCIFTKTPFSTFCNCLLKSDSLIKYSNPSHFMNGSQRGGQFNDQLRNSHSLSSSVVVI